MGQIPFMKRQGFRVAGVCSPGPLVDRVRMDHGIEVHTIPISRKLTPFRDLCTVTRLYCLFRRLKPTIVHSHTPKAGLLGALAALLARVPVRVYTIHGFRFQTSTGIRRALLLWAEKTACLCAHRVIAVSPSLMEEATVTGVTKPERVTVLGAGSSNGVDCQRYSRTPAILRAAARLRRQLGIPATALLIGYVGRIVRDKGIVELSQAWSKIRASFSQAHLLLVGPVEDEDPVPSHILDGLWSDPRVHRVGERRELAQYYAALDLLVLPTYREGLPNVPLEAAAMEIPVVATRVTGCVDAIVHMDTGILVPPRDARALALAVSRVLEDATLRRQMGINGRRRVMRKFQPAVIWTGLLQEYTALLAARGLPLGRQASASQHGSVRVAEDLPCSA